jgi:kumamolisin
VAPHPAGTLSAAARRLRRTGHLPTWRWPTVRHPLRGSERTISEDERILGDAHPAEQIRALVQLRRPNEAELDARLSGFVHAHAAGTPPPTPLAREEWAAQFGATSDDIDAVRTFAREHSLQVVEVNVAAATVTLEGSVEQFCRAFDTHLHRVAHGDCEYRGRSGPLRLPESLQDVVVAALGLDSRPQAQPHCRFVPLPAGSTEPGGIRPARAVPTASYTPMQLAQLYGFPQGDGAGQCIAFIERGGGYREDGLRAYFQELGVPVPTVTAVPVGQGANRPTGDPSGPDGEVVLDLEVGGATAPGATLAVYFTVNTDAGFVQAINAAIHETKLRPSVVSISLGAPPKAPGRRRPCTPRCRAPQRWV